MKTHIRIRFGWFFATVLLTLAPVLNAPAAEEPEDQFLPIISMIDRADTLAASGQTNQAIVKYRESQTALANFRRAHPGWHESTISYRLKYVAEKITALTVVAAPVNATVEKRASSGTTVRLIDSGAEPRQVLRMQPKPDDEQAVSITLGFGFEMNVPGAANQATKVHGIKINSTVKTKSISADGDVTYEAVFGEASLPETGLTPQQIATGKSALGELKGQSATSRISNRHLIPEAAKKAAADLDPDLGEAMEALSYFLAIIIPPLPEEAVGKGAKWEIRTPIKAQGATFTVITTYELASIEGDRVEVRVTSTVNAGSQKIESPKAPGMKMDLTKAAASGTGSSTFSLTRLMPSNTTMDAHGDVSLAMVMGNQRQAMGAKLDLNIRVEAK